jgi:hypothetical protein
MILQTNENLVDSTLGGVSEEFDIEANAKMFDLLSNKIYEDPIRAIIREISCNAIDAHLESGNPDPIHVYLPTKSEPSLKIQDFGIGMTHEDVMSVYKTYGKSTKSQSEKLIGALGIGGKTPLAYTNQFTLSTARDGKKNEYVIFRNENGIPEVNLISTEDSQETGTSIELAVKYSDMAAFHKAALVTFVFFEQLPSIMRGQEEMLNSIYWYSNLKKSDVYDSLNRFIKNTTRIHNDTFNDYQKEELNLFQKILGEYSANFGVIMSNVFYAVDKEKLNESDLYGEFTEKAYKFPMMGSYGFYKTIKVPSGSVSFQASREVLNYSVKTKEFLQKEFLEEFDTFTSTVLGYKSSQDLIDNAKDEDFDLLSKISKETTDKSDSTFKALSKVYHDAANHFFKSALPGRVFYIFPNSRNHKKCVQELVTNTDDYRADIFKNLYLKKYDAVLEMNDPELYVKLLDKWVNKKSKTNLIALTTYIGKYLDYSDYNSFFVVDKVNDYFKKQCILPIEKITDLVAEYDDDNKQKYQSQSSGRATGPRNTEGKCWDSATRSIIDVNDLVSILNEGKDVTYELFEGEYCVKGYYYEPDFTNIGPKNSSLKNVENKSWHEKNPRLPKHHLYVDYTFFKKNELWDIKNLYFYKDWYLKDMIEKYTEIRNSLKSPVIYNEYIFGSMTDQIFKTGAKKYNGFDTCLLATNYKQYMKERSVPKTEFSELRHVVNKLRSSVFTGREDWYIPAYNALAKKLEEYTTQILAEIDSKADVKTTNYRSKMHKHYPMLKFVSVDRLYGEDMDAVIDYIASIDKLELKN